MTWEIEYTDEFEVWFLALEEVDQDRIVAAVEILEAEGPGLRRPLVGPIKSSRFAHMKELIPVGTDIRVLFAFDPRRTAILLLGGNKENEWRSWYTRMVPRADRLYQSHLDELESEGLL